MKRPITNLVIGLLAFFASQLAAQPIFTVSPTTITANTGDIITVNVTVSNFTNIVSFQYSMNWNPAVLQFQSPVGNINPSQLAGLTSASFTTAQVGNGALSVSWYDQNATGVTVADGTILYSLNFMVLSTTGASIVFSGSPVGFEVVNGNSQDITASTTFVPANVNGGGNGGGGNNPTGFALIGSDETAETGTQICVDVSVNGFDEIAAMEYTMEFDETKWQYASVQGFNLPGLGVGNFGTTQVGTGRIPFSWNDPAALGVTLADGTVIYQVCLNAIGPESCGNTTPFQFNGSLTPTEIRDGDQNIVTFQSVSGDLEICDEDGGGGGNTGDLTFTAAEVESAAGSQICVNFTTDNFDCIVSAQFSIHFNQNIIQYVSAQNFGLPDMTAANFGTTSAASGTISFSWYDPPTTGVTLPDGTVIFQLCFNVIGTNGQVANLTFNGTPILVEVTGCNSQPITPTFDPGSVTVGISCTGPVTIPSNVVTPIACPGTNTGAINITVAGGSSTKTYLWSNNATTEDISGLAAGNYTVTVTSCGGAQTTTGSFTVSSTNTPMTLNFQQTNIACFGETNGAIDITVTGGATTGTGCSSYAYAWSNSATTQDLTGLAAGNYTVTVTDCNGCQTTSQVFTVTAPPSALTSDVVIVHVTCNGLSTGSITINATGGGANKEYRLGNNSWGSSNVFSGLPAGVYNAQVRDNFGCVKSHSVTINQPTAISLSSTGTDPSPGQNNGSINLTVTGGTTPYAFSWSGPNGPVPGNPEDPSNLAPGTYCVTVTDANSCTKSHCKQVVAPMTDNTANPSAVIKHACFNQCNGEIDVNVVGGITPYTYTWSGPGSPSGDHPTGLCAGTYSVTVASAQGGPSTTLSFTIAGATTPPSAVGQDLDVPTSSAACNGQITLSVAGGSGAGYTYHWSNNQISNPAIALCEGTYTVTITDGNGCTGTAGPFVLDYVPGPISPAQSSTSNSCTSTNTGKITLSITGGTPPYNYQITGPVSQTLTGSTAVTFTGLPSGNYAFTITDSGIGVDKQSATGTATVGATTLAVTQDITHAAGSQGGSVNITPSGGQLPYSYQWNNGQTSQDLFNVQPGCYELTLVDANGCVQEFSGIGVGLLSATLSAVQPNCPQDDLGSITVTPTLSQSCAVPNLPYTYLWQNAQGLTVGNAATLNNVPAGTYTVTVTDDNGNGISMVQTYDLEPESSLTVTAEVTSDYNGYDVRCYGQTNGKAKAFPHDGDAPYSYLWSNGKTTQDVEDLGAGTIYSVEITDAQGCKMTAFVTLDGPPQLTTQTTTTNGGCSETDSGQATVIVSGGVPDYTYEWSNGGKTKTITNLEGGKVYFVTVTDFNGCAMVDNVNVLPNNELHVTGFSVPDSGGPNGQAGVIVSGGTPPYEYTWQDHSFESDSILTELFPGEYLVLVTDANDCQAAELIKVGDETLCGEVRTIITPEGDGKNEDFKIECLSRFSDNTLEIFNRWGQLVYSVEDYNDADLWRGTTKGGDNLPDGVYFYVFNYYDPGTQLFVTKKGSVTVLRK